MDPLDTLRPPARDDLGMPHQGGSWKAETITRYGERNIRVSYETLMTRL